MRFLTIIPSALLLIVIIGVVLAATDPAHNAKNQKAYVIYSHIWHNKKPIIIAADQHGNGRKTWMITKSVITEWWSNGIVSQTYNYNGKISWEWYCKQSGKVLQ